MNDESLVGRDGPELISLEQQPCPHCKRAWVAEVETLKSLLAQVTTELAAIKRELRLRP